MKVGCGLGAYFQGRIDEVRIYNRVLGSNEVGADMTTSVDQIPPEIDLSGALTEGLEEGKSAYPLTVHATDGHGAGVDRILIGVDGKQVARFHQSCTGPGCSQDAEWTFNTEIYPGEHEVTVTAIDLVGNSASRSLTIIPPNGALPGCSPLGEQTEATPTEVASLPGGGANYIYEGAEGELYEFPQPPPGFDPLTASNEELERYAFEPKPTESGPRERWEAEMALFKEVSPPGACVGPELAAGPGGESGFYANPTQSGFSAQQPKKSKEEWLRARVSYSQPEVTPSACPNESREAAWVGLGLGGHGFFQAGTTTFRNGHPRAFGEKFFASENHPKAEKPIYPPGINISHEDQVVATVRWKPNDEQAVMTVKNLSTGVFRPMRSAKNQPGLYYGKAVTFRGAERPAKSFHGAGLYELAKFSPFKLEGTEMLTTGGEWERLGEATPFFRENLREVKNQAPVGSVMAESSILGGDKSSFTETWRNCHP